MTLPPFNFSQPLVDRDGYATKPMRDWMTAVASFAKATEAVAAVPAGRNIVTIGGLHGGGSLAGDIGLRLYKVLATVANLPMSGNTAGDLAYAQDGRKPGEGAGVGTGVVVFWSKTAWYAVTSGAVVTA